jgi:hypothetical protein
MRLVEHVAHMGRMKRPVGDLGIDERILIKMNLKELGKVGKVQIPPVICAV